MLSKRYIHIIVVDVQTGEKQIPVDITDLGSDYLVYLHLNQVYREQRAKWRALTTLKNLKLLKVSTTNFFKLSSLIRLKVSSLHNREGIYLA